MMLPEKRLILLSYKILYNNWLSVSSTIVRLSAFFWFFNRQRMKIRQPQRKFAAGARFEKKFVWGAFFACQNRKCESLSA